LEFEDGSRLKADLIVFATGFERNMKNVIGHLFDEDTASQMGDFQGFDEEGELRRAYKPCGRKCALVCEWFARL
jgi:hypothetical protein